MDSQQSLPSINDGEPGPSCSSSTRNSHLTPVAGPSSAKDDIEEESSSDEPDVQAAILDAITNNFNEARYEQDLIEVMNRIEPATPMREIIDSLKNPSNKKNFKNCSTSSESEHSDNKDSDSSSSHSSLDAKKKKYRKKYKYLPSDESDLYSSSEENITSDEGSPKFQKRMLKARMRDILSTGYEQIRKKFGKRGKYASYVPKGNENIQFPPNIMEEMKNPYFDEEGRAIINYDTTDEFSRFVLFQLPNIIDNGEYDIDNTEGYKKWVESLDQQNEEGREKHNDNSKKFDVMKDVSDLLTLDENCGFSSAGKSKKRMSKQNKGKKTPKVPAKRSNSKACHNNKGARKLAKASPRRSIASSKCQKSKTTVKPPKKPPATRVKHSNPVSVKSAKSTSKKAKDKLECMSAQKRTPSSLQKARTGLVKKNASKQSKDNVKFKSQKFITPSPKKIKTGLASKATLKQSKGNLNKRASKSIIAPSKMTRISSSTETAFKQANVNVQNQTIIKSPEAKKERKSLDTKIVSKRSNDIIKNPTLLKRGRKSLAIKIASKQSEENVKSQTLPKSPVTKKGSKSLATKITSKKFKDIVKNRTFPKSAMSNKGSKCLASKSASKRSASNFENQTLRKSTVAKRKRDSSTSQDVSKQSADVLHKSSEFSTPPLKKMRTSLAKRNTAEVLVKSSHKLSSPALHSKLSLPKKSKSLRSSLPSAKGHKISLSKVSVVSQKQNKAIKEVTKLNKSVKSKESVASVVKQGKQSVKKQNLGLSKSSSPCKTKLVSRAAKRGGMRSQNQNTFFTARKELKSSTIDKPSKTGKSSNLKQNVKQSKVDRSLSLRGKNTEKSITKSANDPMLQAKRVLRVKKK